MIDLVVVGLGYVGLPLVAEACRSGMRVIGLDANPDVVAGLNAGFSHVDDLSNSDVSQLLERGFSATSDVAVVGEAAAVVICVPTPLSPEGGPDLGAVRGACMSIAPHLKRDTLVVLESTTYPGTTSEVVSPLLEAGSGMVSNRDFWVAFSPERIDPGNAEYGLRNTPKIVGADSETAAEVAETFYRRVVDTVVVAAGTREAEAAKLLENTYRHVNIALVNEMSRFFHELKIDFWDVIRLAETKPFGFHKFTPGPGVGGHCIPIDPNYLSHRVRSKLGYAFRFVELAQEINSSMPSYVSQRATRLLNEHGKAVRGSRVLLLGVTYKADIVDQRESPAIDVANCLLELGAELTYFDPLVMEWSVPATRVSNLEEGLAQADLVILLQAHSSFDIADIESRARMLLDTRGVTTGGAHRL
ncbi:nucleotide sugar dehydrogenase [Nocardioides sp. cx-169]|uniref:nucleotide sugar dehydrogenase n=1 Tax=Nocardioides sp. cx-169 TaxID=2899080 RepID=UPI001E6465A2|nr:nucleotide sugar dehydrogenase [Nocardioides sp. cx-169]MCD4533742.1 nucleotide sugar dehydrogenase [Nocardioides sp. cx-169]